MQYLKLFLFIYFFINSIFCALYCTARFNRITRLGSSYQKASEINWNAVWLQWVTVRMICIEMGFWSWGGVLWPKSHPLVFNCNWYKRWEIVRVLYILFVEIYRMYWEKYCTFKNCLRGKAGAILEICFMMRKCYFFR